MTMLSKREWIALATLLCGAAALRAPGMANELWLDEVWSLTGALSLASPAGIFTALRTDNNHHLISLWLYLAGPDAAPWVYRSLSMACGLGSIVLAFLLGRAESWRHAVVTALLFAGSFPYVYYSSEARGYAPVVFFTLAAWFCLQRVADSGDRRFLWSWWAACGLGVLAHQTFVLFFIAALAWCDIHVERTRRSVRAASRVTALAFAPPAVAFALFYFVSLRGIAIAGGPSSPRLVIVTQALAQLAGASATNGPRWFAAALIATLFVWAIVGLRRRGDDRWILYAGAAVLGPALLFLAQPSASTYPRYFLVPTTFVLLACADTMARALASRGGRLGVSLLLGGMLWGSVDGMREVAAFGRGRFDEAVREMDTGAATTVSYAPEFSRFDFRGQMLVDYYARRVANSPLRYVGEDDYPAEGTDWIIRENIQVGAPIDEEFIDRRGNRFSFVREYKAPSPAGIAWRLYRKSQQR